MRMKTAKEEPEVIFVDVQPTPRTKNRQALLKVLQNRSVNFLEASRAALCKS